MARRAENTVNEMKCVFPAKSINEGLARLTVSSFISQLDPPVSVLSELKTAVSEAVTNCIVHAYRHQTAYYSRISGIKRKSRMTA